MPVNTPKTVLITGAADRIGAAMATDLAAAGSSVVIHANRSTDKAEALADMIRADGGKAAVVSADLTDAEAVEGLINAASKAIGDPIICLINNASLFAEDSPPGLKADLFEAHFKVHATAPAILAGRMASALPDDQHGLVVNMIDQRVWALRAEFTSYTASKVALWGLTQTLALAMAPRVRVNGIGPGPTLKNDYQSEDDFAAEVASVPLKRGPDLFEFAQTVLYLWRTPSITGQMIALDGGQHLGAGA